MRPEDLYTKERHEAGSEMQVKDQFGKVLDLYITLVGVDSLTYKNASRKMRVDMVGGKNPEEARAEAMADCTLGWRGWNFEGEEVEFTKEAAKSLYMNAFYILDQCDDFFSERRNFIDSKEAQ